MNLTTEIITLVIRIIIAILCGFVLPAVQAYFEAHTDNAKMEQIRQAAETAVYAAEQLMHDTDPDGEKRRKYAAKMISMAANRAGICLTNTEIDAILQAAVQEINLMKYGALTVAEDETE